jgi:hypothetical protein
MGELVEPSWAKNYSREPDSPLYEVRFTKLIIFASLERTKRLLSVYGHEAALGSEVLELVESSWLKRSLYDDEKDEIVQSITIQK